MLGKPTYFSLDTYLAAIDGMINADEVERALWMIDNPPAYYRANPPAALTEMREQLHRRLWTPVQYKGIYDGAHIDVENQAWPLRAAKLEEWVRGHNEAERCPHIMELAPGGGWIMRGLEHRGLGFTYQWLGLDHYALAADNPETAPPVDGAPVIFCAFEIIEHLSNEWEIYQNYLKLNRPADTVMLSTPLYTYAGGMDGWQTRELGHLRTYSPVEFHAIAARMFQGFDWECLTDDTILLTGRRK